MGTAIVYYIVKGQKLNHPEFEKLNPKPELPKIQNFKVLKDFVELNTNENAESAILIDTDKSQILLDIK